MMTIGLKALLTKRNLLWVAGFVVLFALNIIIEEVLFPAIGLDGTAKNDFYFLGWWVAVIIWAIFGHMILYKTGTPKA